MPDTRRTVVAVSIQMRSTHIFSFHSLYSGTATHRRSRFPTSPITNSESVGCQKSNQKRVSIFFFFLMFAVISQHSTKYYPLFVHTLIIVSGEPDQTRKLQSDKTFSREICWFRAYGTERSNLMHLNLNVLFRQTRNQRGGPEGRQIYRGPRPVSPN